MRVKPWSTGILADSLQRKSNRDPRRRKRLNVSLPVHLRPFDARFRELEEVGLVADFTRDGMRFITCMPHYRADMRLEVTFPYGEKVVAQRRFLGVIVRIEPKKDGTSAVGVRFLF